jgi:hypothetical protein
MLAKYRYYIAGGVGLLVLLFLKGKKNAKSNFKTKLINLANAEFNKWNRNGIKIKEGNKDTIQDLRKYWKNGAGINQSDNYYINNAWSASFISYLMKQAGAETDFKYNSSHSVYIRDAVKNRKQNNSKKFKAYRPNEVNIQIGDLVCYPRQAGVNYDTTTSYMSHCDLIISADQNTAVGVGGNVSNSVSKTTYALTNGKIDKNKDKKSYGGIFTVIKNLK